MTSQHSGEQAKHEQVKQEQAKHEAKKIQTDAEAVTNNPATAEPNDALEAARADIADLKATVASLLEHLQSGAKEVKDDLGDGLKQEAGKLSEQMRELFESFSVGTAKTTTSLEQQVQSQPIRTLAIAVGAGFVLSRLIGSRK
jgi:ElaB/YqjD/DUF883 family membrane-anchored ribosome-binding protein